jgi:hypothetical protein
MRKSTLIIFILIVIAIIAGGVYYWLFFKDTRTTDNNNINTVSNPVGFLPLNNTPTTKDNTPTNTIPSTTTVQVNYSNPELLMPKLRKISSDPVAGMFASTTKVKTSPTSTTTIEVTLLRYVDRGTGHVYQANNITTDIEKISNTTLPKIYEAYWNKNLTFNILRYLKDSTENITNFYAEIRKVPSSIASSTTPYEIKGKFLSNFNNISISPSGDRIFTWTVEGGKGIGHISTFDEKTRTKIAETPLTQINTDWPETSTVTITTKGNSIINGYTYTINTKTADMRKVIGPIRGLSSKMSSDGKYLIYSEGGNTIDTRILNTSNGTSTEVIFKTLADKCVWSKLRKNEVYCSVPTEIPEGSYPEDWYKGSISFTDQIWVLNVLNGEVHLLANPINLTKSLIDATDLTLDPKENYLYFINKRDLSLWSIDLNK